MPSNSARLWGKGKRATPLLDTLQKNENLRNYIDFYRYFLDMKSFSWIPKENIQHAHSRRGTKKLFPTTKLSDNVSPCNKATIKNAETHQLLNALQKSKYLSRSFKDLLFEDKGVLVAKRPVNMGLKQITDDLLSSSPLNVIKTSNDLYRFLRKMKRTPNYSYSPLHLKYLTIKNNKQDQTQNNHEAMSRPYSVEPFMNSNGLSLLNSMVHPNFFERYDQVLRLPIKTLTPRPSRAPDFTNSKSKMLQNIRKKLTLRQSKRGKGVLSYFQEKLPYTSPISHNEGNEKQEPIKIFYKNDEQDLQIPTEILAEGSSDDPDIKNLKDKMLENIRKKLTLRLSKRDKEVSPSFRAEIPTHSHVDINVETIKHQFQKLENELFWIFFTG